jgi:hypothetical protein
MCGTVIRAVPCEAPLEPVVQVRPLGVHIDSLMYFCMKYGKTRYLFIVLYLIWFVITCSHQMDVLYLFLFSLR